MIKRPTWILLILLALVFGAYSIIKEQSSKVIKLTPTPTVNGYLIMPSGDLLQSLYISDNKGNIFRMQRDLSKTWVITLPSSGVADQGLAGAAETQVGALRIVTMLETPPETSVIGLGVPTATLELGFISGITRKIEVGNITPTGSGYYVRYDGAKFYVISQSGIDSLLNLLAAPPYPATETPSETTNTPMNKIISPTP
jgi:hypothetical protein